MFRNQASRLREKLAGHKSPQALRNTPRRLYKGLPSVLLAILLNTLDAASTGLLVFPSSQEGPVFAHLQVQAMSIYIVSTITSQLTMTLGGSLFPGALGSMLIEVLPFLRGIATDIQGVLGRDSPNLLPTVVAAYAMTSFLVGFCFLVLGLLRLGWTVEYIPSTVLNGTIGAIGLSLFLLGLQLTLPPTSPELTLSSASHVLFIPKHAPLLLASLLPTVFLCISLRSDSLSRLTRGFTEHAMYVPCFVFSIAAIFWIIVAAKGDANGKGMSDLGEQGWLFIVQGPSKPAHGLGTAWNYWKLFNFSMVEWSAMSASIQNIVLLVIIGVLNLPIYIPAMGLMLNQPKVNMNWELIGHGLSNIFSGAVGSLPNLVVLSNSRLFTFAGGGRPEALVSIGLTVVLFFASARILPYVPTILASILVMFLGLDLMTDALWSSAQELLWSEWAVVLGTMLSCTFVSFLPGFAIGFGLAIVQHFGWDMYDLRASTVTVRPHQSPEIAGEYAEETEKRYNPEESEITPISRDNETSGPPSTETANRDSVTQQRVSFHEDHAPVEVVSLYGNIFFGAIPSLERQMDTALKHKPGRVIIDFSNAHRCETCIGQLIKRKALEYTSESRPQPLVFSGTLPSNSLSLDLARGGVSCYWPQFAWTDTKDGHISCYPRLSDAVHVLQPSRKICHDDSDSSVLGEVDYLFGNLARGRSIGETLHRGGASIYRVKSGGTIPQQGASCILVVRGTFKVQAPSPSHARHPGQQKKHTSRLPLTTAVIMGVSQMRKKVFRPGERVENEDNDSHTTLLTPTSDDDLLLGPGDSYWPRNMSQPGGCPSEVITALQDPCWAISLPSDLQDMARYLLVRLERRRMYDRVLSRRTWKFR